MNTAMDWLRPGLVLLAAALMSVGEAAAQGVAPPGGGGDRIVLMAPAGGRGIALGGGRTACVKDVDLKGWMVERDGRSVRPPAVAQPGGPAAVLPVAGEAASCAAPTGVVELVVIGPPPVLDATGPIVDVDAGQVSLQGRGLRWSVLTWQSGDRSGSDVCIDPVTTGGVETCMLAIERGLPADPTQLSLALFPPGSRVRPDAYSYDALGLLVRPEARAVRPARIVVAQLVKPGATLDLSAGLGRLALLHPEAIASLDCQDAFCALDGSDVLVRSEHGSNDALEVQVRLRPRVFLRKPSGFDPAPNIEVPLQRCPVAVAGPPPLRGVGEQALVLRLGGRCSDDNSLQFYGPDGRLNPEKRELSGGERWVVLRIDRTSLDEVPITVRRGGTVVGVATARTRAIPPIRTQLRLPGAGPIDFIPTNREAELIVGKVSGGELVPLPVEGAYTIRRSPEGSGPSFVRGDESEAGSVALRFAYRDPSLPPSLRDLTLATLVEPVQRRLHDANVPRSLEQDQKSAEPLIELLCEDGHGPDHLHRLRVGTTEQLPYRLRDTCRLVLHRERLRPEDGTQALQVSVEVTAADGSARGDAKVDQHLVLKPGGGKPRTLFVTGVAAPFDRVVVRVSIIADDAHYATLPDDKLGAQLQWSVVVGSGRLRLYATTAIPTGLYRVADEGHQGILTLNAGAILRLVLLSREGKESPLGLETGLMWLGITGDTSKESSAHGEFAVVAGLGLGIPIANQSRAAQTSISLHAWFEYEVSRAARGPDSGTPYGFVFGPSITVGDLGFNF